MSTANVQGTAPQVLAFLSLTVHAIGAGHDIDVYCARTVHGFLQKQKNKIPVGPVVLGFFIFVVVGSAILQIIQTATRPAPPV